MSEKAPEGLSRIDRRDAPEHTEGRLSTRNVNNYISLHFSVDFTKTPVEKDPRADYMHAVAEGLNVLNFWVYTELSNPLDSQSTMSLEEVNRRFQAADKARLIHLMLGDLEMLRGFEVLDEETRSQEGSRIRRHILEAERVWNLAKKTSGTEFGKEEVVTPQSVFEKIAEYIPKIADIELGSLREGLPDGTVFHEVYIGEEKYDDLLGKMNQQYHETGNPLGGAVGNLNLLRNSLRKGSPFDQKMIGRINRAVQRTYVQLEALPIFRGEFPEGTVTRSELQDMVDLVLHADDHERIAITATRFSDDVKDAKFRWSLVWVGGLLENVIQNVRKNPAPEGGKDKELRVFAEKGENEIILTFEDNGPGFPQEILEKGFQKGASIREGSIGGKGLGMWAQQQAIEHYGGGYAYRKYN